MKFVSLRLSILVLFPTCLSGCQSTPAANNTPEPNSIDHPAQTHLEQRHSTNVRKTNEITVRFKCEDSAKFTIRFGNNKAFLKFSNSPKVYALKDDAIAEGSSYSNAFYVYDEHKGEVTLSTLSRNGVEKRSTKCHIMRKS